MSAISLLNKGALLMERQLGSTIAIAGTSYPGVAIPMNTAESVQIGYAYPKVKSGISVRRAVLVTAPAVGAPATIGGIACRVEHVETDEISHDIYVSQR